MATAINANTSSSVSAAVLNGKITLTAKTTGATTNYTLATNSAWDTQFFSCGSFAATPSSSTLAGGANAVDSSLDVLSESYEYDAWGNMTQAATSVFSRVIRRTTRSMGSSMTQRAS